MATARSFGGANWASEQSGISSMEAARKKADFGTNSLLGKDGQTALSTFRIRQLPTGRLHRPGFAIRHLRLNMFVVGVSVLAVRKLDHDAGRVQGARISKFHPAIAYAPFGSLGVDRVGERFQARM